MLLSPCTTPASATTTLTVPNPTQGFGASALSDWHTGWLVGDALAPAPAATEPLVPHLPHPMAPQGDLPLSPSEPLIISSPPPHPCPTRPQLPAASSSSGAPPEGVWAEGSEPRVLPSSFVPLMCHPAVVGSSCTLWAIAQNPEQKERIDPFFSRGFSGGVLCP